MTLCVKRVRELFWISFGRRLEKSLCYRYYGFVFDLVKNVCCSFVVILVDTKIINRVNKLVVLLAWTKLGGGPTVAWPPNLNICFFVIFVRPP